MRKCPLFPLIGLISILAPLASFGWGGRLHMDINRAAALDVPDEMAAWRAYDRLLSRYSIQPDLWKADDTAEGPRHYIDVERFRDTAFTSLPVDRAQVVTRPDGHPTIGDGIAPWVILEAEQRLTRAMASNQWTLAMRWAGTLGHYVGDLHQPLHATEKFDDGNPLGTGIHVRWEDALPKAYWQASMLAPAPAVYLTNVWPAVLGWIAHSHEVYPEIYAADRKAREASDDDVESAAYYRALWYGTRDLFVRQASLAVTDLASLWYTAWVNAGKPAIPAPPEALPTTSVWTVVTASPAPSAKPFFIGFGIVALVIVVLSMRKKGNSIQ